MTSPNASAESLRAQRRHLPESSQRKVRQLRSAYLIEGLGEQAVVSVNCRIAGNTECMAIGELN